MYEQLSKHVGRVIKVANEVAREYEQDYVGTEHVLLAIAREQTGVGGMILQAFKIDEFKLKKVVDRLIQKSMEDTWVFGRLPGTPHFRNVMAKAIEEAQRLRSREVCTEHVLLALANEKGSVAEAALTELGATPERIQAELDRMPKKNDPTEARRAAN